MHLFCSHCGAQNSSTNTLCSQCDSPIGHVDNATSTERGPKEKSTTEQATPANYTTALIMAGVCGLYLINPTAGFLELIPDNLPIIGNLDEAAATAGLLMSLSKLGLNPFKK